ncbi:MAG TPA: NAD(P)H-dependent oxidoreductase [Gemmatimonadaceae bacterium]|nr:NAD(P)H-dependent oxidoreductase [Gemmatimonadaceae bacterium]
MAPTRKVAVIVGSLRTESFTRKVANALVTMAPKNLDFAFVDLGNVSYYNQDLENTPPADWVTLRESIQSADALLFATPEYNRSVPGALKNAIDVASRPYGKSAWNGKPGAVVSVSPGQLSGFGANHHLRQMLVFLNVPTMQQPEAYIGGADKLFDQDGNLTNDSTRQFLQTFMTSFAAWVELVLAGK